MLGQGISQPPLPSLFGGFMVCCNMCQNSFPYPATPRQTNSWQTPCSPPNPLSTLDCPTKSCIICFTNTSLGNRLSCSSDTRKQIQRAQTFKSGSQVFAGLGIGCQQFVSFLYLWCIERCMPTRNPVCELEKWLCGQANIFSKGQRRARSRR